jgi:hypothetical protein
MMQQVANLLDEFSGYFSSVLKCMRFCVDDAAKWLTDWMSFLAILVLF